MSVDRAAVEVAIALGRATAAEVDVIRVAYYECANGRHELDRFFDQFLFWRDWVLNSNEDTLGGALDDYGNKLGQPRRQRLDSLLKSIRCDPRQALRNREWHLERGQSEKARIESNHWDPVSDWYWLATDLWVLGRLHAGVGDVAVPTALLERALHLWKTCGTLLLEEQAEAINTLQREIALLAAAKETLSSTT